MESKDPGREGEELIEIPEPEPKIIKSQLEKPLDSTNPKVSENPDQEAEQTEIAAMESSLERNKKSITTSLKPEDPQA